MRLIKFFSLILCLILLTSCTSNSKADVNILLSRFDESLSFEAFKITYENNRYKYSSMIDSNTLLCIYTDKDGIAVQCTLTCEKESKGFNKSCIKLTEAFTCLNEGESKKLLNDAIKDGRADNGEYNLVFERNKLGTVFIINNSDDALTTNENPTLKRHVDEDEISRPTLATGQSSVNKAN